MDDHFYSHWLLLVVEYNSFRGPSTNAVGHYNNFDTFKNVLAKKKNIRSNACSLRTVADVKGERKVMLHVSCLQIVMSWMVMKGVNNLMSTLFGREHHW